MNSPTLAEFVAATTAISMVAMITVDVVRRRRRRRQGAAMARARRNKNHFFVYSQARGTWRIRTPEGETYKPGRPHTYSTRTNALEVARELAAERGIGCRVIYWDGRKKCYQSWQYLGLSSVKYAKFDDLPEDFGDPFDGGPVIDASGLRKRMDQIIEKLGDG